MKVLGPHMAGALSWKKNAAVGATNKLLKVSPGLSQRTNLQLFRCNALPRRPYLHLRHLLARLLEPVQLINQYTMSLA